MTRRFLDSAFAPWTGLFVGAAAWFADHQIGADTNTWDCATADGPFVVVVGLVCLALAAAGGATSWLARPEGRTSEPATRRFARIVGTLAAAIFGLAIAFGTWAGVLVPGCLR